MNLFWQGYWWVEATFFNTLTKKLASIFSVALLGAGFFWLFFWVEEKTLAVAGDPASVAAAWQTAKGWALALLG